MNSYIIPDWPAPKNVHAYFTTRNGGCSRTPFDSFNLADDKGDSIENVTANRIQLKTDLKLKNEPAWLQQVHDNHIINVTDWQANIIADGSFSLTPDKVCVVMTADCLPILLFDQSGKQVMALHGGWRGLAAGIIAKGIPLFHCSPKDILVWLGPAIGPKVFEVGTEVREQFLNLNQALIEAFVPSPQGRWLMDIYAVTTFQLNQLGVTQIFGEQHCTFTEKDTFFSYRRDGGETGRMAGLIYFE